MNVSAIAYKSCCFRVTFPIASYFCSHVVDTTICLLLMCACPRVCVIVQSRKIHPQIFILKHFFLRLATVCIFRFLHRYTAKPRYKKLEGSAEICYIHYSVISVVHPHSQHCLKAGCGHLQLVSQGRSKSLQSIDNNCDKLFFCCNFVREILHSSIQLSMLVHLCCRQMLRSSGTTDFISARNERLTALGCYIHESLISLAITKNMRS